MFIRTEIFLLKNQYRSCKLEASGNLGKTFARHCGRHEQTPWRWKRFSFRWKMFLQVEKSPPSWNLLKEVSLSCKKRKIPEAGSVHCALLFSREKRIPGSKFSLADICDIFIFTFVCPVVNVQHTYHECFLVLLVIKPWVIRLI